MISRHLIVTQMGPGDTDSGMPAIIGIFFFIFIVVTIVAITMSVVKFTRTRQMAIDKGATDSEALAVALSGDVGTAAAFVKPATANRPAAERVREVRELQSQGLITEAQADIRIAEILRTI